MTLPSPESGIETPPPSRARAQDLIRRPSVTPADAGALMDAGEYEALLAK